MFAGGESRLAGVNLASASRASLGSGGASPCGRRPQPLLKRDFCLKHAPVDGLSTRIGGRPDHWWGGCGAPGTVVLLARHRLSAIVPVGCQGSSRAPQPAAPSFPGISLAVGALDDAAILAGVTSQRGEWMASRSGEISVQEHPLSDDSLASADVVLFPAQRLGDLVKSGVLKPIANDVVVPQPAPDSQAGDPSQAERERAKTEADDSYHYMDIAPAFREQVSRYGPDRLALPCGGSALVLVYRRDAFESQANRAGGAKSRTVPGAAGNLDTARCARQVLPGPRLEWRRRTDYGIALGPRAGRRGSRRRDISGTGRQPGPASRPLLVPVRCRDDGAAHRQPTVRRGLARSGRPQGAVGRRAWSGSTPLRSREAFRTGKVALLDRSRRTRRHLVARQAGRRRPACRAPTASSSRSGRNGAASPPNSPSYLPEGGGWLIGVNGRLAGTQLEAAIDFAKYLTNPENSNRLRAERAFPMLPVRSARWVTVCPTRRVRPTSTPRLVRRGQPDPAGRSSCAGPADSACRRLPRGPREGAGGGPRRRDPDEALQAVAKAWTERTRTLGTQHQSWHYRRSLNSLATLPHPPERGK